MVEFDWVGPKVILVKVLSRALFQIPAQINSDIKMNKQMLDQTKFG